MDVGRFVISFIVSCLIGSAAMAGELAQCLFSASEQPHRLEKENSVRHCFNQYKSYINKENCYLFLAQKVSKMSSIKLSEDINAICFYDTSAPKSLNSCLKETKKFKSSGNHDEAVFFCYQQFQDKISQKDCLTAAEQMIYPFKKEYLRQHCYSYNN